MMNIEQARSNMIQRQLRTTNVLDEQLLDLLAELPREKFVPLEYRDLAFADINIPLGHGQQMMTPSIEAKMLLSLAIKATDKILEIGTGSGFVTAALAKLGQHVYSVDMDDGFIKTAGDKLAELGITNVTLQQGDAATGWDKQKPYDVICITGSMPALPQAFKQQLAIGGRLFVILGKDAPMEATLITRVGENDWRNDTLFETVIPPLRQTVSRADFIF